MSRYDYRSLSSQDSEELTRDLLQAEWNIALEAFKTGRDSGIDLRYAPADGGKASSPASFPIMSFFIEARCDDGLQSMRASVSRSGRFLCASGTLRFHLP